MFDTMTLTKATGALCGALLIFLLGKWAADSIYAMESKGHGGHGDDHHAQAYVIDTGDDHGGGEEEETVDLATLMASADLAKGEKVFGKCKACHKLEQGANATGPYLYGVVGRPVDSAEGFGYSGALAEVVDTWTPEHLFAFLESPKGYAPGTTMAFNGLKKPEDKANLIAFLDMTDGDMTEMAAPAPAAEEGAAEEGAAEEGAAEEAATEEEAAVTEEATEEVAAAEGATEEAAAAAEETAEAATEEAAAATEEAAATTEEAAAATEETAAATEEAAEAAPAEGASGFAALVAAADVAKGKKAFNKCKACHTLEDGKNRVGPHLFNLIDRPVASVDGFKYSGALTDLGGNWGYDELSAFLENPKAYAKGNKMTFAGLKKEEDRAAVIAFIEAEGK